MRSGALSVSTFAVLTFIGATSPAFAWGERGHHTVCEVATRLLTNTDRDTGAFYRFMLPKGHMMGHVCNLPDISWRSLPVPTGSDGAPLDDTILDPRVGDEAHFINPENFGMTRPDGSPDTIDVHLNYADVEKQAVPFEKGDQTAHQVTGSNWWRTQQLYSKAIADGSTAIVQIGELVKMEKAFAYSFQKMTASQKAALQDVLKDYIANCSDKDACKEAVNKQKDLVNQTLRSMLISMGLMGHFVGDAGQPFHNSADYNGKESGHYGIHSYYESQIVDQLSAGLAGEVYDAAGNQSLAYFNQIKAVQDPNPAYSGDNYNVIARMRKLSDQAGQQMKAILDIESSIPGFTPGELHKAKTPTGRPYADELFQKYPDPSAKYHAQAAKYHDMIVTEIGVSAKVLATFWGEIYANLNQKAKALGSSLSTSLGDTKLAELDLTKYYTTFDYPLDTPYIAPSYLSSLSLKALPAGSPPPPPPGPAKSLPLLRGAGDDGEELPIETELGDVDNDARFHAVQKKH